MGLIDKKKLIEELINNIDGCTRKDLIDIIQNFPEEPEIDMDQLRNEVYSKIVAPKPKQLPVKRTWTLKKEYYEFANDFNVSTSRSFELSCDPVEKLNKYYDLTKTPDYSQVNVGDVVEIVIENNNINAYGIVTKNSDSVIVLSLCVGGITCCHIHYSTIKSLTILKAVE